MSSKRSTVQRRQDALQQFVPAQNTTESALSWLKSESSPDLAASAKITTPDGSNEPAESIPVQVNSLAQQTVDSESKVANNEELQRAEIAAGKVSTHSAIRPLTSAPKRGGLSFVERRAKAADSARVRDTAISAESIDARTSSESAVRGAAPRNSQEKTQGRSLGSRAGRVSADSDGGFEGDGDGEGSDRGDAGGEGENEAEERIHGGEEGDKYDALRPLGARAVKASVSSRRQTAVATAKNAVTVLAQSQRGKVI